MSTLLWLYTGWVNFGSLGGEVKDGSVFVKGLGAALLLDVLMYAVPFFVAFSKLRDIDQWEDGSLVAAYSAVMSGLGVFVSIAGCASAAGLYLVAMLCYSRTLWGMADKRWIPSPFAKVWKRTGCPIVNVAVLTLGSLILGLFDFEFLITLEGAVITLSTIPINMSLIMLRIREPDAVRPIRFPLGTKGIIALMCLPILLLVGVFSLNVLDWQMAVGVAVCLAITGGGYLFYRKYNTGFLDEEEGLTEGSGSQPRTEYVDFGDAYAGQELTDIQPRSEDGDGRSNGERTAPETDAPLNQ